MDRSVSENVTQRFAEVLNRALVASHLLTGSLGCAEQAVLAAIKRCPDQDAEQLTLNAIDAAACAHMWPHPALTEVSESYLPQELTAVLELDPRLRSCFVLRSLIGLPTADCARLLRLLPNEIDECNVIALRRLASR